MDGYERTIFHVDVNSAFLSWSALKILEEDPDAVDLRTIPSGVGGDVKTRHGIITKSTAYRRVNRLSRHFRSARSWFWCRRTSRLIGSIPVL